MEALLRKKAIQWLKLLQITPSGVSVAELQLNNAIPAHGGLKTLLRTYPTVFRKNGDKIELQPGIQLTDKDDDTISDILPGGKKAQAVHPNNALASFDDIQKK